MLKLLKKKDINSIVQYIELIAFFKLFQYRFSFFSE